jgi:hypothetical protein
MFHMLCKESIGVLTQGWCDCSLQNRLLDYGAPILNLRRAMQDHGL